MRRGGDARRRRADARRRAAPSPLARGADRAPGFPNRRRVSSRSSASCATSLPASASARVDLATARRSHASHRERATPPALLVATAMERSRSSPAGRRCCRRCGRAHGDRWTLPASVPLESIAADARQVNAPCPALVQLGVDDNGRDVYVDLEAIGALEIGGPITRSATRSLPRSPPRSPARSSPR